MALLPVIASAAWFNSTWTYRVPINVPAGASVNSTIKLDVDFNSLLTALGVAGTFDVNSPRVTRPDGTTLGATQEFTDTVYAGATDAAGNGRGEVRFILQDAGPATYYLYFDIVANGPKAANAQPPINGNFERGVTGTQSPAGWTATKSNANYDAQVRPSETVSVTDSGSSGQTETTDGTPYTGAYSYLLGARTKSESGDAYPAVTLSRPIAVPAINPGNLVVRFRQEGWDSSDDGAGVWDFLSIQLVGSATTEIVGPNAGNYVTYPFSPNKGLDPISASTPGKKGKPSQPGNSGYGYYNYWDMNANGTHLFGMTRAAGSQPWDSITYSLTGYAGQTITLKFMSNHAVSYKSWTHIDDVEWSVVPATLGAPESGAVAAPGGFNAYETATPSGAITGVIQTKIAGSPFNLDLVALNTAKNALLTSFTGAVKVELLDSSTGGALDTNGCNAAWPTIQTLTSNPTFAAANNGRMTVGFQENDAWRNVRVRVSYPASGTPTTIGCSTDNFSIRPAGFTSVSVSDTNWGTSGTARSLYNTAASGGNVHQAGRPFSIAATAVNGLGNITGNYNGSPAASVTACLLPSGCTAGVLSPGSWSAASGTVTSNTATYSEAGALTMQLVDSGFASVDANDGTPQTCAGGYVCSGTLNVGRFVPDHFSVTTSNTPSFKTFNDTTCSSRSFTYIGQGFGYVTAPQALITAQNAAGVTTQNYRGALWRPLPAFAYSSVSGTLDSGLTTTPTVVSNNDGTGSENVNGTDLLAYVRNPATPQAPFNANISLNLSVTDSSETGVTGNGTISTTSPAVFNGTGSGIAFDSGNAFRYGRLRLSNAFGSELLDLPIPAEAQYWNGTVFVTNTADNCTTIAATNIAMSNYLPKLSACETAISIGSRLNAGKSNLKLVKPGAGNNGSVYLTVNLGTTATGQTCVAPLPATQQATMAANQSYLQGKWTGASYDQNPHARATFGVYKNANEFIYMREMY